MLSNMMKTSSPYIRSDLAGKSQKANTPPEVQHNYASRQARQTGPVLSEKRVATTAPLRPPDELNISTPTDPAELLAEIERQARELQVLHRMRAALTGLNN